MMQRRHGKEKKTEKEVLGTTHLLSYLPQAHVVYMSTPSQSYVDRVSNLYQFHWGKMEGAVRGRKAARTDATPSDLLYTDSIQG